MGKCWGDIDEGVRVEVVNSDTNLSTKVYWIAEIIKLAGKVQDMCHVIKASLILFQITCIFIASPISLFNSDKSTSQIFLNFLLQNVVGRRSRIKMSQFLLFLSSGTFCH